MATTRKHKKNLIVSYKNLTDDLKEKFKEAYPEGYNNYITKFVKPNGEAIFVVPFDTEDTAYMVKFDVKIDTLGEDLDKALFDEDSEDSKEDEFAPLSEAIEKEENDNNHKERHLRHGDFEDMLNDEQKHKASLEIDKEGIKAAFAEDDEAEELDSYETIDNEESTDDDFEPSDDDLRGIEDQLLDVDLPTIEPTQQKEPQQAKKKAKSTRKKTNK